MTQKQRIRTSIILTISTAGAIGVRLMMTNNSQPAPPQPISDNHGAARPQPPILTFSHPSIHESHITVNNETGVVIINQRVALTERKPGLHHGQGNAPSLPLITKDYGITLKHLEDRIYSFDTDSGLMVWTNGGSFIYYDPNISSIFAAKLDFDTITDKPQLSHDGTIDLDHNK
ncbi:MAG: hypothetical protein NZL83_00565 [Candidatus Absconditabacterales bacterium]|nr:hypothetical protein [Candidatus Absconditabacterales bacterium]